MKTPLISVIVLTYKNYDKIEKNLNSIFSQTYENIEIIISDDGAENFPKKKIEKILEKASSNIKNIIVIERDKNVGTVKNFNEAIKRSSGEYIFPLAQDDYFYNNKIVENLYKNFGDNEILIGLKEGYIGDKITGIYPKEEEYRMAENKDFYEYLIYKGNIFSGACTYYKKILFEKYGYFDENYKLLEDYPMYLKLLRQRIKLKVYPYPTIKYSMEGMSNSKKINKILENDLVNFYKEEAKINKGLLKEYLLYLSDLAMSKIDRKYRYLKNIKHPKIWLLRKLKKI